MPAKMSTKPTARSHHPAGLLCPKNTATKAPARQAQAATTRERDGCSGGGRNPGSTKCDRFGDGFVDELSIARNIKA